MTREEPRKDILFPEINPSDLEILKFEYIPRARVLTFGGSEALRVRGDAVAQRTDLRPEAEFWS
ncbi:hypothetical protein J4462_04475 [Candidatus Pacearchaeota archaeon]|nr:hypothetical protein [Candidatus Pacearchaeota archaeon]